MAKKPTRDDGELNPPWIEESRRVLAASKAPRYWLLVSREEMHALAGGVVCARTRMQAAKACESIGGLE